MNEDSEQAITDAKYGFITGALKETFTDNHLEKEQTTRVIDSIVTHRIWGYPIFFSCSFTSCLREPLFWVTTLCKVLNG